MSNRRIVHIVTILALLGLALASSPAEAGSRAQEAVSTQQPQPAVDPTSLLQPDGTLDVPAGTEGSFNVDGWQMALDDDGQPHFYQAQPTPNAHPDDPFWSSDFLLGAGNISDPNSSAVFALAVSGNLVYVGGDFSQVGSIQARNIACWNIDTYEWSALGNGTYGSVSAIAVYGDFVYAGGTYIYAGGNETYPLARWDTASQSWSALGTFSYSPSLPHIDALAVAPNGDLYVGGRFYYVDSQRVNHIALLNASGWHSLEGGVGAAEYPEVFALAFGPTGGLIAGGRFTSAGGYPASNLAQWNGESWHAVGSGVGGGSTTYVTTITVEQGMPASDIYVGGKFSEAYDGLGGHVDVSNVAQWDGFHWSNMGGGVTDTSYVNVNALINHSGNICAGGSFDHAGAIAVNNVACWTGADWMTLRDAHDIVNGVDNTVFTLAENSDFLFLGGTFHKAGRFAANHVTAFRYLTETWNGLGASVNHTVNAIAISGGDVYVGGSFSSASAVHVGSNYQAYLARWHIDSNRWYVVGTGALVSGCTGLFCTPTVNTIFIYGDDVYIGGNFTRIGSLTVNGIARFRTTGPDYGWHALGSGVACDSCISFSVRDIARFKENIYIGGRFDTAGGLIVNNLAYWDGLAWNSITDFDANTGTDEIVYALNTTRNTFAQDVYLYVGGAFTTIPSPYIARWNGANWSNVGSTLNGTVYTVIGGSSTFVGSTPLYIGGDFTSPQQHVARLSANSWVELGDGLDDTVRTLAFDGKGGLYAGGDFEYSGIFVTLFHIGHWDGTEWSALGSGIADTAFCDPTCTVNSIAVSGNRVMAAGNFTTVGGKPSFFLASWNKLPVYLPVISK